MTTPPSGTYNAISKALYRSLLKIGRIYGSAKHGPILCSLLHRSGIDDQSVDHHIKVLENEYNKTSILNTNSSPSHRNQTIRLSKEEARNFAKTYDELLLQKREEIEEQRLGLGHSEEIDKPHILWYKKLLRELLGDEHKVRMSFPSQTGGISERLQDLIKRDFRVSGSLLNETDQHKTAFLALRILQNKLELAQRMGLNIHSSNDGDENMIKMEFEATKDVNPIPTDLPTESYIRPGSYLVAHPFQTGCFAQTVVCILDHSEMKSRGELDDDDCVTYGGTYGIVINKTLQTGVPSETSEQKRNLSLREIIRNENLPEGMKIAFENCVVRDGGPVNMSIQMLRAESSCSELQIGGTVLPMITEHKNSDAENSGLSAAHHTDEAIYYGGDVIRAAQAVIEDKIKSNSFSFVIGATCWETGQLEREIRQGYWLPCSAPPEIAFTGQMDTPGADTSVAPDSVYHLWFQFMTSIGEDERKLAHLILSNKKLLHEYGSGCDDV